ncbi:hypothetical protein [Streptomyces massasporeus]|uniref:hypothetical protein n=1 Tax=Streptomyces massasporeus TaxID=67324 RepID=UPI0036FD1B75
MHDAQQLTAKSTTGGSWSYDAIGNETAGASTDDYARTAEKWIDHSPMWSITLAGMTYAGRHGSADQSERVKLGDTFSTMARSACRQRQLAVWTWASTANSGAR